VSATTTIVLVRLEGLGPSWPPPSGDRLGLPRREIETHGGRVATTTDHGLMALFPSAYDAVRAAVRVQQALEHVHPDGQARIGVNVGEVVADGDDGFGTAVATARELCLAAAAGDIVVSDIVRLLVGSRADCTFDAREPVTIEGSTEPLTAWTVPWTPLPSTVPIRVVVADDAALIRAGIVRLLSDGGLQVIAEADDFDGVIRAVDADPPDLLVTDIRMPPTHSDEGLRAAARVRATHPGVAVLVLSQYVEAHAAAELLDGRPAGIGYLLKERVADLSEFLDAARRVAGGESVIDPLIADELMRRRRGDDALERLTSRERDVLSLMAQGKSNAAIAHELVLGQKTVETHVRAIFQKLDLEENADEHRRVVAVVRWLQAERAS